LAISFVTAFQKDLQPPPFVVDTCDIKAVEETIFSSSLSNTITQLQIFDLTDDKIRASKVEQAPKCAFFIVVVMSIKGCFDRKISA